MVSGDARPTWRSASWPKAGALLARTSNKRTRYWEAYEALTLAEGDGLVDIAGCINLPHDPKVLGNSSSGPTAGTVQAGVARWKEPRSYAAQTGGTPP